jgi:hypothetical protein
VKSVKIRQSVNNILTGILLALVWLYRHSLRVLLGGHCRYTPSCSEYFIGAVKKYGPWRGTLKGLWRIMRCHPFAKGGYDPY